MEASTGFVNVTPYGFHFYGSQFLAAARAVRSGERFSPVGYYLYCRSLELLLKAFLLAKGWSKKEVKDKLGHDLERALQYARAVGLEDAVRIDDAETAEVAKANAYYCDKGFEYFEVVKAVTGYPDLPELATLDAVAGRLAAELRPICLAAA